MPFAILNATLPSGDAIKRDTGVIEGCKLCENGKLALFTGVDGKPVEILMNPQVVDKLLALWSAQGEGSAHWTHDWIETGRDGLDSKVATWKNFRKNAHGDLVADAHLWDTPRKETILSAAERDPRGIMVSQVFDYTGGRNNCNPISVQAADFVERGAATTSLLAKLSATKKATMAISIDDLKEALATPEGKEMVRGCIEGHDKAADMAEDDAAAMESDAGVTDDDKKGEKQDPALMRAVVCIMRCSRAINRRLKAVALSEEAILKKAKVQMEAAFAGEIGKNKAILSGIVNTPDNDPVRRFIGKIQAELAKPKMDQPTAIMRARKDALRAGETAELEAWEKAGRPMKLA